jgi:hypothetical protein
MLNNASHTAAKIIKTVDVSKVNNKQAPRRIIYSTSRFSSKCETPKNTIENASVLFMCISSKLGILSG